MPLETVVVKTVIFDRSAVPLSESKTWDAKRTPTWFPVNKNQLPLGQGKPQVTIINVGHKLDFLCHGKAIRVWIIGNDQSLAFFIGSFNRKIQSPCFFWVGKLDGGKLGIRFLLSRNSRTIIDS